MTSKIEIFGRILVLDIVIFGDFKGRKVIFWTFSTSKMAKKDYLKNQILTKNLDFRGHLSNSGAEHTPKSGSFKSKNIALILAKQLQNNLEKVQKMTFSTPKMVKNEVLKWPNFDQKSRFSRSFINLSS